MIPTNASEEYQRAMHAGQKEKKRSEAAGRSPYPAAFDELFPELATAPVIELPVQDIPADRIVGTKSSERNNVFSASFLPLPEADSEFAAKWTALCHAHLTDEGISDPILCYEYLGNFYVQEGNKRTSVLKYFGAPSIPAKIKRIMPIDTADPRAEAYSEFVEFHQATGIYDIQFKKTGEYAALYAALGKKPKDAWTEEEIHTFESCYHFFKEAFLALVEKDSELLPENALLLFLKVHSYDNLRKMTQAELKKELATMWEDVRTSSEPEAITVKTVPDEEKEKHGIKRIIASHPKHINVAFIYQQDESVSPWTKGHLEGANQLAAALAEQVAVKNYFHADSESDAAELLDKAVEEGADVIFTTTPPLLRSTLKAALKYPKVRFFNCTASQPISSVRSYYSRTYEGKFVTGAIAGALAENDLLGYIGSYPILGVPASINAFALGAKMTNPRAKIVLEWNCVEGDCVGSLKKKGVKIISSRDIPLPEVAFMEHGDYGTFSLEKNGVYRPIASPCWIWGKFYEKITRSILSGVTDKKGQFEAVNYWWGMDSGVIDVTLSEDLPSGVKLLAEMLIEKLKAGELDPFRQKLVAQDGGVIADGKTALTSMEILHMDRLAENVIGRLPDFEDIVPKSRAVVRELGIYAEKIPPETEKPL